MKKVYLNTFSKRKESIAIIVIAFVLSFVVVFVYKNNSVLFANISGVSTVPEFSEVSDIGAYIDESGDFNVIATKTIVDIESMSLLFVFDPEVVHLDRDAFSSVFATTYAAAGKGKGEIILNIKGNIEKGKNILKIRTAGDVFQIVLGDTVVHFVDGSTEYLSVAFSEKH